MAVRDVLSKCITILFQINAWATVETRIKEPTFLGNSMLKDLIFALYKHVLGMGKGEFDKDITKLYIYSSCIFSYHLFYLLSYFCQNGILISSLDVLIT